MKKSLQLIAIVILTLSPLSANAGWELDYSKHSAWTDNKYLGDPDGWGMFLSKSLSKKIAIRVLYTRFENKSRYIGTLPLPLWPPGPWYDRQFISENAHINLYELALIFALIDGTKMRLEVGGGVGGGIARVELFGEQSGHAQAGGSDSQVVSLSVQILVKELIWPPLALRMGYRTRYLTEQLYSTDGFAPFLGITISSVQLGLVARL